MTNLQLTLTVDEVNTVLEALGQQPYVKVFQLIDKIQQQAAEQLQLNGKQPVISPRQEHEPRSS